MADGPKASGVEAVRISVCGVEILLRGDRTALIPATGTLLLADLHLGKAETFQHYGLRVPTGSDDRTLARLREILERVRPEEVIVLGDLLHRPGAVSRERRSALLEHLRDLTSVSIAAVPGNHDRGGIAEMSARGVQILPEGRDTSGLRLFHMPPETASPFVAGHTHPVVRLSAPGERLRLPCFVVTDRGVILPAFGAFTGGHPVTVSEGRLIAIWEGALVDLGQ